MMKRKLQFNFDKPKRTRMSTATISLIVILIIVGLLVLLSFGTLLWAKINGLQ